MVLYFTPFCISKGLKKLWILHAAGAHKCYLAMHYLTKQLSDEQCSVTLVVHIFTGCDYISKIGTKFGALCYSPEEYFLNFEEEYMASDDVKVYKNRSRAETFHELRTEQYVGKSCSLIKLAQTCNTCTSWKMWTFSLVLVKTLPNLSGKRKMFHFYLKTHNVSCQNISGHCRWTIKCWKWCWSIKHEGIWTEFYSYSRGECCDLGQKSWNFYIFTYKQNSLKLSYFQGWTMTLNKKQSKKFVIFHAATWDSH